MGKTERRVALLGKQELGKWSSTLVIWYIDVGKIDSSSVWAWEMLRNNI